MRYTFGMYSAILIVHIAGAVATGIVTLYASGAMLLKRSELYRRLALVLAAVASFEVVTGTALAVLSANVTVASVCGSIALYVAAIACVEVILFMRMNGSGVRFPFAKTIAPVGASIALLLSGVVLGL